MCLKNFKLGGTIFHVLSLFFSLSFCFCFKKDRFVSTIRFFIFILLISIFVIFVILLFSGKKKREKKFITCVVSLSCFKILKQ